MMRRGGFSTALALVVSAVFSGVLLKASNAAEALFPTDLPASQWVQFRAAGFSGPVPGVIYRLATPTTNGMPLGGVDTGCIDLETSGLWGYCTIFNTHVPRRGPLNLPFLGISVGGQTWVLCDPGQVKQGQGNFQPPTCYNFPHHVAYLEKQGLPLVDPIVSELKLEGVRTAKEIHYWGHYPVADLEYETDAPVKVGLRAWAPFFPGDVEDSLIPGIVFEVHLRNPDRSQQRGTAAFSFPGPTPNEAGSSRFQRHTTAGRYSGVIVGSPKARYTLGVIGPELPRLGGELGADGASWAGIARRLPEPSEDQAGASAAVDFVLAPGETKVVRFLLAWHSPQWNGGGRPWTNGNNYTHMYALRYRNAQDAARLIAQEHPSLLRRVLAWQQVIYSDEALPIWLRESLVNNFHLITEVGLWAAAKPPIPDWVRPEDGLFGLNECPRTCPQIECIPCDFYGNLPVVYFFPKLALSTLRGFKGYQFPEGAVCWIFGGWTGQTPPIDFASPTRGYQFTTNGICLAAMVDRYALCWGDAAFTREFYDIVKKSMIWTVNLRPEYEIGDRVIAMPTGNAGGEWFEAQQWFGLVTHAGGLHLAQLRIALRMAEQVGDEEFARQCREWLEAGQRSLETNLWDGTYYLNCFEPETGRKDDLVFGYQLDGQWVADFHGVPGIFRKDRAETALETIKRCNAAISSTGAVNYAHADGTPAPVGGYGTYSYMPPEVLMLAMTYMYHGHQEFGMDLARRCWENIVCKWRYTWDMPNIIRGDVNTGERSPTAGGHDYYQDMMLWALPAAMAGEPMNGPMKPGGLVDRVLRAAQMGKQDG